jgi:two-component system NtrC family sensor kinase
MGAQGIEYSEKLYKQAQRTHRIVQNLLSFARQHKPERVPVQLNLILEETLALRDYDLRMNHIRVHLELAPELPYTSADPHQLQQVFLNMVNNAVDAMLEHSNEGDLWVRTGANGDKLFIEFTDSLSTPPSLSAREPDWVSASATASSRNTGDRSVCAM